TVLVTLHTAQLHAPLAAPQKIRSGLCGSFPQRSTRKQAICQTQHSGLQMGNDLLRQRQLTNSAASEARSEQHMGSIFQQGDETKLRISAAAPAGWRTSKCLNVLIAIGNIQSAAIQTHDPPFSIPRASRMWLGNRSYDLVVNRLHHFPSQPLPCLRDAGLACDFVALLTPQQPMHAHQQTPQHLPATGSHPHSQTHHVIDHQMSRKIAFPLTGSALLLQNLSYPSRRISSRQNPHCQLVRDTATVRQVFGSKFHALLSCPKLRPNTSNGP